MLLQTADTRRPAAVTDCADSTPVTESATDLETEDFDELQAVTGFGATAGSLNSIELELSGLHGGRRFGRVEGLAPMDLLGEFQGPAPVGELVSIRLRSGLHRVCTGTYGLIHWQRCVAGRWLTGLFLRDRLPDALLQQVWMDMRRELRFPSRLRLQVRFTGSSELHAAVVCDYSRSGARLLTPAVAAFSRGVQILDGDLLAAGLVRYTKPSPHPGSIYVGCEFADNEGVRIARRAVLRGETGATGWNVAEQWLAAAAAPELQ